MIPKQIVITLILIPALLSGAVAAQENETAVDDDTSTDTDGDPCETIDENTAICSAELDGSTAELIIESETNQRITFTDAGAFIEGGEIRSDTRTITEGENRVTLPVTQADGYAGVSVETNNVAWAVPLEEQSQLVSGPITTSDLHAVGAGSAVSVSLVVVVLVWRSKTGQNTEPERVA